MYSKKRHIISVVIACVLTCVITLIITLGTLLTISYNTGIDVVLAAKHIVTENYVDPLSEEQINNMNDAAIAAMVGSLEDPYSFYFNEELYDQFEENNEEEHVGIGVTVEYSEEDKYLLISAVNGGSPAEKSGIIVGDKILGVDEVSVEKNGSDAVIDYIKGGKEGEVVTVHILRGEEKKSLGIKRELIVHETITVEMLDNDIAYIKISNFQHNSVIDFAIALDQVEANNACGMIIDLRGNPGGYADSVLTMTDMLLPEGNIAYLEDNKGQREYFNSDADCIDIPMVVLINESTASAAELMTGSLQAYDKAVVVGMKSYGKAVAQAPFNLTEETAIYLTTARYYTPEGECIDKKGIVPDVEIDLPEEQKVRISTLSYDEDVQIQKAIEVLIEKMN